MRTQAEENLRKAEGIIDLYDDMKTRMADLTRSRFAIHVLDWVFQYPIFSSTDFASGTGVPAKSARRVLQSLLRSGLLETLAPARGRRPTVLLFPGVLDIVDGP